MKKNLGFTLVELMVVISILAILAVSFFVNFKAFGEDAVLKNTASDIQSALRLAQANATARVKCGDEGGVSWSIQFSDRSTFNLKCSTQGSSDPPIRKWPIPGPIYIDSIDGMSDSCQSSFNKDPGSVISVSFSYSGGQAAFVDSNAVNGCLGKSTGLVIKLKNNKDDTVLKTVTLDKGGSVNVQ